MTSRIIVLFTLKAGVDAADYERWALARDLPNVRALPSVAGFDVFRATGTLGGSKSPYDYIEIIDIADDDGFWKDVGSDTMKKVAAEFAAVADATFITTTKL